MAIRGIGKFPANINLAQPLIAKSTTKAPLPINAKVNDSEVIDRIVIFYQDGSFKNYITNS